MISIYSDSLGIVGITVKENEEKKWTSKQNCANEDFHLEPFISQQDSRLQVKVMSVLNELWRMYTCMRLQLPCFVSFLFYRAELPNPHPYSMFCSN